MLNHVNQKRGLDDITNLTPLEESKIPAYRQKWLEIGTSCTPCDFEESKHYSIMAYEQSGLTPPKHFHLCDSPIHAAEVATELKIAYKLLPKNMDKDARKLALKISYEEQVYGYHEASWLAYYDFMLNELNIQECKKVTGLIGMAKHCGWWSPYSENAIFQHKHTQFKLNSENELHCDDGPSVSYKDGNHIWAINGINVNEQIVMAPETQTIKEINEEKISDIRSIRIDRYGWVNYIKNSKAKCVDSRHNYIEGTKEALYKTKLGDSRLVVTCPTGRIFALGVPSTIKNCEQAQKWLGPSRKLNVIGRT